MKKLYYSYIGNRLVHLEYYIDNKRIELPTKIYIDMCANCAAEQWIKDNDIKDDDIRLCPATHKPNVKSALLFEYCKEGVFLEHYVDGYLIETMTMTFTHSLDAALKFFREIYGLQRKHIEVYHIGAKDFLLRKFGKNTSNF